MQSHLEKIECKGGLGEEHYRYDRADDGIFSRDHGRCGGKPEEQKSPDSAMRKVDTLLPLNNIICVSCVALCCFVLLVWYHYFQ